jgi:cystathionine beta-lyase
MKTVRRGRGYANLSAMEDLEAAPLEVLRRRRSAKWRAYPSDVLPLTVAELDFALAPPVAAALSEALACSDTGYATGDGLGEALAQFAGRRWGWEIDPAAVTPAPDVGMGVVEALRALTGRGGTVVVNTPVYPPFFDWVPAAGARVLEVPLSEEAAGFRLDLAGLAEAFATGPTAYVLCNPHNPVGRAHSRAELAEVAKLATRFGVTVVSDEIHGPLTLAGSTFTPMLSVPGAARCTITVLSATKAWNLAGLKCALVVTGSPEMASVVEHFAGYIRPRLGHLGALATVAALREGGPWLDRLLRTLSARRDQLGTLLARRLPVVRWHPPEATSLAWLDCRAIGTGFAPYRHFLEHARVALEPGPRFGTQGSGYVRLNFATGADLLEQAIDQMASAL